MNDVYVGISVVLGVIVVVELMTGRDGDGCLKADVSIGDHCVNGVFFFHAEVGIRVRIVTGVQAFAFPICWGGAGGGAH